MSATPDLSGILADLAAGRIDAAEASRRIDAANRQADDHDEKEAPAPGPEDGPAGRNGEESKQNEERADGRSARGDAGPRGFFDESWNRVPPEAREGLRSAWRRVAGAAESVVDAASGQSSPRSAQRGPAGSEAGPRDTVTRLSVHCVGRRVTIIGDPGTPGVQVEGKHNRRRIGDVVEITSEGRIAPDLSGLLKLRFPKDAEGLKDLGLGPELIIRMHPDLALEVELAGGALRLSGVPDVDSVRVTAAVADIADVHHIGEALFQAGGSTLAGPIDTGRSRIRVESGNLTVRLAAGTNVAIRADARPGLISWPDGGASVDEYIVGNGAARMDMSTVMGRIAVRTA